MPTFKISEVTRHELERFKEYMRKQEYTDVSVTGYCTYLSRFLRQTAYTGTSGRRIRKHPDTKPEASGHFAG